MKKKEDRLLLFAPSAFASALLARAVARSADSDSGSFVLSAWTACYSCPHWGPQGRSSCTFFCKICCFYLACFALAGCLLTTYFISSQSRDSEVCFPLKF